MRSYEFAGKKCYNHLGGELGATLFDFLISQKWIKLKEKSSNSYIITDIGYENFAKIGLELPKDIIK